MDETNRSKIVKESKKEAASIEGNYNYNIWYDKYFTDRNQ